MLGIICEGREEKGKRWMRREEEKVKSREGNATIRRKTRAAQQTKQWNWEEGLEGLKRPITPT